MHLRTGPTLTLLTLALLTACGGGGGDDDGDPVFGPYNVAVAWQNGLTTTRSLSVSGRGSDNRVYALTEQNTPRTGSAVYPRTGQAAIRVDLRETIRVDGGAIETFDSSNYYVAPAQAIGSSDGSACTDVAMSSTPLPTAASIGDTGTVYAYTAYDTCASGATVESRGTATWSLVADDGVVYLCIRQTETQGSDVGSSQTTCLETATSGALSSRARIDISLPAQNFTLTAYSS